jgi:hypothetical protein
MEKIYYLIHTTDNPDCINWTELRSAEFNTNDQFPGVYLSIITKDNINKENVFPGKYIIILSKKLLLQKNYHINLTDYNGIVSEKNTYFPWNLHKFMSKNRRLLSSETQSEVVFHDDIDMKYCCCIISILKKDTNIKINNFLPKIEFENEKDPDMTKDPFFCYPFENIYTGSNPLPKSSNKWYEMMSKVCKVDTDEASTTPEDIIEKIKNNVSELYKYRDKQNIDLLKQHTQSKFGGNNNKSKTKRKNKKNKQNLSRKNK